MDQSQLKWISDFLWNTTKDAVLERKKVLDQHGIAEQDDDITS